MNRTKPAQIWVTCISEPTEELAMAINITMIANGYERTDGEGWAAEGDIYQISYSLMPQRLPMVRGRT